MRVAIFLATVLLAGCPSGKPDAPRTRDDRLLRIRVARAEAGRLKGVLVELANSQDHEARMLALRGLGRIGATAELLGFLSDRDPSVSHAAQDALGLAASLDETSPLSTSSPGELAPEAFGRAGDASLQPKLVDCAQTNPACAIALGRMGRRKIRFSDDTRLALARLTSSRDAAIRYAAVYALQREYEPPADEQVSIALVARVVSDEPETRANAIAALVRRKAVASGHKAIEDALRDQDWRIVVEAIRALANADDMGREAVAVALVRRRVDLASGDPTEAHVIIEGLRALIGKPIASTTYVEAITQLTMGNNVIPALTRSWIECLALAAQTGSKVVDNVSKCGLPDHLRLPLLGDLVKAKVGDAAMRRAALTILLAHQDPRVKAAGIGALAPTWQDDPKAQPTIVGTIASALGAKNPIVAGSAVEAAPAIYDAMGKGNPLQAALDNALVARATTETDVELSASLYELIGNRLVIAGADACRSGLATHPVRAKAAGECLRALGQGVTIPPIPTREPPIDVTVVIGKKLRWHLATTRGEIVIELRPDVAPWAVATIVELTRRGYYDGIEFHRVVPNFVVQGGDPTMSGWGGPGFAIPAEPSTSADGPGFVAGGVGIADAGRDSGGSQWFIMHSRAPHLDGRYTWIGQVISGQKSADALLIGDKVERATIEQL